MNAILDVRVLASRGILARVAQELDEADLRVLRADAYRVVTPVVFQNHTHRLEIARRHYRCTHSFQSLAPECLDRFHDDLEAVIDYLFRHAILPIESLEGWVTRRLQAATVDGYRRRRGSLGALQRPRLPKWLSTALGGDPRLERLALQMLEWVGVERTAGASLWPLDTWADQRALATGDLRGAYRAVADDVERVLVAMRRRPNWFEDFVERPMSRKQLPVAIRSYPDASMPESRYALRAADHEMVDAHVRELVAVAIEAIERRIVAGQDARTVVTEVLETVFNSGTGDVDQRLDSGTDLSEAAARRLADPATLDGIVAVVLELMKLRAAA